MKKVKGSIGNSLPIIRTFSITALLTATSIECNAQAIERIDRQWINDTTITDASVTLPLPHEIKSFEIEVGASMKGLKDTRGKNKQSWNLELMNNDSVIGIISISWGNNDMGSFDDYRYLELTTRDFSTKFTNGVSLYNHDNALVVTSPVAGKATVSIGDQYPQYAGEISWDNCDIDAVRINCHGTLEIGYISAYCQIPLSLDCGLSTMEIMERAVEGAGQPCGIWVPLDRENDPDYARPGGNYTLAAIPDKENPDNYFIIYMDGAVVNDTEWRPGMIKGRLQGTPFEGMYRLQWYTSTMEDAGNECNATLENGILSLNFPLLNTRLRYRHP